MICPKCAAPVPIGMDTCPYCGAAVTEDQILTPNFEDKTDFATPCELESDYGTETDEKTEFAQAPSLDEETQYAEGSFAVPEVKQDQTDVKMPPSNAKTEPKGKKNRSAAQKIGKKQPPKGEKQEKPLLKPIHFVLIAVLVVLIVILVLK